MTLLEHLRDVHSQNGEDGVIAHVFSVIGDGRRHCCEFGAWDGLHLSNTRALIEAGWSGALIEADAERFAQLEQLYADRPDISCVNATVGTATPLRGLLELDELDFLSIDIDGFDYQAFRDAGVTARAVCVEVNAGHDPESRGIIPDDVAEANVGQPLGAFADLAADLGYRLIGYTGNAFFLHEAEHHEDLLPTLTPTAAYADFLDHLDVAGREWLYLVNLGLVAPQHVFSNPHLAADRLGISPIRAFRLRSRRRL